MDCSCYDDPCSCAPEPPTQWELYANPELDGEYQHGLHPLDWWERANAPTFHWRAFFRAFYSQLERVHEMSIHALPLLSSIRPRTVDSPLTGPRVVISSRSQQQSAAHIPKG